MFCLYNINACYEDRQKREEYSRYPLTDHQGGKQGKQHDINECFVCKVPDEKID